MEHEKKPDDIGGWSSWARLVLQKQEEHDMAISKLQNPDHGFSILRCQKHDKAIEDFRRLQYGVAFLVVIIGIISPIIVPLVLGFLKSRFGITL